MIDHKLSTQSYTILLSNSITGLVIVMNSLMTIAVFVDGCTASCTTNPISALIPRLMHVFRLVQMFGQGIMGTMQKPRGKAENATAVTLRVYLHTADNSCVPSSKVIGSASAQQGSPQG